MQDKTAPPGFGATHYDFSNVELSNRRMLIKSTISLAFASAIETMVPSYASAQVQSVSDAAQLPKKAFTLTIRESILKFEGRVGNAFAVNDAVPGPLLRFREGDQAKIRVINSLKESSSIHWHGLLLPPGMDGVPGVSFAGIDAGSTFDYDFPIVQSGTYWYHSHSGAQEQQGIYGPIIIDPIEAEPYPYERDYVVMLSDWTDIHPVNVLKKLKNNPSYFNHQRRTVADFFSDVRSGGLSPVVSERLKWARMRMDPTDISDVTGATYTYLLNGNAPSTNWTGLYRLGERIRLRFIGAGAMTIFDVRIPGLKLKVIQTDGQYIQAIDVDEIRIAPGETYDVIVEPTEDRPYTIFAETIDRSGYARGTLSPKAGMQAPLPARRSRPVRGMSDMGMNMPNMEEMKGTSEMSGMDMRMPKNKEMEGMGDMSGMGVNSVSATSIPGSDPIPHNSNSHGNGNSVVPEATRSRLHEPGIGLDLKERRVLVYTDLQALFPGEDQRQPEREIELHLTGNMERYSWSIDGKKFSEASAPIPFTLGERLRLTFVNDTMMEHPMHLHGMWMYLENGSGKHLPRKHTVLVKSAERLSVAVTADALGFWALHCHLLLHMETGMFRIVHVRARATEGGS